MDQPDGRLIFLDHQTFPDPEVKGRRVVEATIIDKGKEITIDGRGNGPIDGFVDALSRHLGVALSVLDYSEHSIQRGSNAAAICYMEMEHPEGPHFRRRHQHQYRRGLAGGSRFGRKPHRWLTQQ